MVCGIIITIYTLLLLVASLLYVKKRYSIEKGALTRTAFKAYWVLLAITAAVLLLFVTLSIQYSLRNELLKLPVLCGGRPFCGACTSWPISTTGNGCPPIS